MLGVLIRGNSVKPEEQKKLLKQNIVFFVPLNIHFEQLYDADNNKTEFKWCRANQ